jgi:starch phosphorylase
VELYADGVKGGGAVQLDMTRLQALAAGAGGYAYSATVSSARPATDYTARIMPHCDGLAVPLEAGWIRWQR